MKCYLLVAAIAIGQMSVVRADANSTLFEFAGVNVDEVRTNQTLRVKVKKPLGPFKKAVVNISFDGLAHQILCHAYFSDMVMLPWTISQMEALIPDVSKRFDCELVSKDTNRADRVRWTFKMKESKEWQIELTAIQMKRKGQLPSRNLATLSIHREPVWAKKYDVPNESEKVPIPKEPPTGDIGDGQDEKWVRATFPKYADMILKKGYENWLMEWVGIMRQNGHYKQMLHIGSMTNKSVELYCGPYRVHVTKPGTYSFPLEVFEKYTAYTEPRMELKRDSDDGFRTQEWFYKKAQETVSKPTEGGVR